MYKMAGIKQRFKEIAYKNFQFMQDKNTPKDENIVFLISDKLERGDFKEPFFNKAGVISLGDGFKFLTYCGKNQRDNINKNALVIQKKLSKGDKVIYRVYLMDKDGFKIRNLFNGIGLRKCIDKENYNLSPSYYMSSLEEEYNKEKLVFIINKIVEKLVNWSLKQK